MRNARVSAVLLVALVAGFAAAPGRAQRHRLLDRWEIEFDAGVQFNQRYGGADIDCIGAGLLNPLTMSTTDDCRAGLNNNLQEQFLGLDGSDALSAFQQNASVHYNRGLTAGVRLGFDLTSRLQIEFRYSYGRPNMSFDARFYRAARDAIQALNPAAIAPVTVSLESEGRPEGHLKFYQWDLVYHFRDRKEHKLVPYMMGGAGFFRMGNGPTFHVLTLDSDGSISGGGLGTPLILTRVATGVDTTFACSFGVGTKYYFTRHLGMRLELRNSLTFPRFEHSFSSKAVSNFLGGQPTLEGPFIAPTGTVTQKNNFNSVDLKAGFIFRF